MSGMVAIFTPLAFLFLLCLGQQVLARRYRGPRPSQLSEPTRSTLFRGASVVLFPASLALQGRVPLGTYLAGCLIMAGGVTLTLWAQQVLGKSWLPGIGVSKGHKLVTGGPYRYVRHPLYSGFALVGIGGTVATLNPVFALAYLLFWLALAIRIPFEEQMMARRYKRKWDEYASSTGLLLPGKGAA